MAQRAAQQADIDKCDAQKILLDSATAHAALQRKVAAATVQMAAARQTLLALETTRLQGEQQALAALESAIVAERELAQGGGDCIIHTQSAGIARQRMEDLHQAGRPGGTLWRVR